MEFNVKMLFELSYEISRNEFDLFWFHNIVYNSILLNAQLAALESEQFLIKDFYLVEVGDDSHHVAAAKYWNKLINILYFCQEEPKTAKV